MVSDMSLPAIFNVFTSCIELHAVVEFYTLKLSRMDILFIVLSYLEIEMMDFAVYGMSLAAILDFGRHIKISSWPLCLSERACSEVYIAKWYVCVTVWMIFLLSSTL